MKKHLLLAVLGLLSEKQFAQSPATDPCWSPVWTDNFKAPGQTLSSIEALGWGIADNFDHGGEPQVFKRANASVNTTDGLVFEVKPESPALSCPTCIQTIHYYSSASIGSNNWTGLTPTHLPQFGYIEAKISIPDRYGLFPAFWIWYDSPITHDESVTYEFVPGSTVTCGDSPYYSQTIDKNLYTSTLHWDGYVPGVCNNLTQMQVLPMNDYTTPHIYGIEWSPSKIIWYIDNVAVRNAPNPGYTTGSTPGAIQNPSSIILNLSLYDWIEASNHGDNAAFKYDFSTNVPNYFPSAPYFEKMKIEYVNYYDLDMSQCSSGTPTLMFTTAALNAYDYKVKNNISIDGSGTTITVSSSSPPALRASAYISITADFEVPLGEDLYLDITPCY